MTEILGYSVAKRIRELPAFKDAVLIAMTDYGNERDEKRSLEAGFDRHLVKPVSFATLTKVLAEFNPTKESRWFNTEEPRHQDRIDAQPRAGY